MGAAGWRCYRDGMANPENPLREHRGGCHCGAVAFTFRAPAVPRVLRCNCSLCAMTGFEHIIVPASAFRLVQGEEVLTTYRFLTRTAKHLFCSVCGVKSFYVPRSNPDGFSISLRCVVPGTFDAVAYEDFDGQNWDEGGPALAALSKE